MSDQPDIAGPVKEPFFKAPGIVLAMIAVLIGIHIAIQIAGPNWEVWSLYAFSFIPARITGSISFPAIYGSQVWSFVTYAFLHGSWGHLFSNAIWLLIFGTVVARRLGNAGFLVLCLFSVVAGAAAMLATHWGDGGTVVGVSGAVSGLMAAAIPLMFGSKMQVVDSDGSYQIAIKPLKPFEILSNRGAIAFLAVFFAMTLYSGASGWTGTSYIENASIAWEAHIGGFIAGLFSFYALDPWK